jgi:hypothetical protein
MPDAPEKSFTVDEFCELEQICRSTYYGLQRAGLGPDEIFIGSRRRITAEARRRWHRKRERAARRRLQKSEPTAEQLKKAGPGDAQDRPRAMQCRIQPRKTTAVE